MAQLSQSRTTDDEEPLVRAVALPAPTELTGRPPSALLADGAVESSWFSWLRDTLFQAFTGSTAVRGTVEVVDQEQPWLVPGAIAEIERQVAALGGGAAGQAFRALEWGAGRSTLWLARLGLAVVSIEARAEWLAEAGQRLAAAGLSGRVEFIPVASRPGPALAEACAQAALALPPRSFDLVLIDGHFKRACLARAPRMLAPGGLLVLDDAGSRGVEDLVSLLLPTRIGLFDNGIWQTAIFRAPAEGLPEFAPELAA